jgi:hypothetical protein
MSFYRSWQISSKWSPALSPTAFRSLLSILVGRLASKVIFPMPAARMARMRLQHAQEAQSDLDEEISGFGPS